ncbi:MAG: formylglycine-generating enzyme family protein [Planctomycetaceae bacterium]
MRRLLLAGTVLLVLGGAIGGTGCGQPEGRTIGGINRSDRGGSEAVTGDAQRPPPAVAPPLTQPAVAENSAPGSPSDSGDSERTGRPTRRKDWLDLRENESSDGLSADHIRPSRSDRFLFDPTFENSGRVWQLSDSQAVGELFELTGEGATADSTRFWAATEAASPALWMHHVIERAAVSGAAGDYHLPEGFAAVAEAGQTEDGFPWRIRCEADGALMGLVPAGPSHLGSTSGPEAERPAVQPGLEGFYIDLVEVTVGQYQAYRDDAGEKRRIAEPARKGAADEPVTGISWTEAKAYATWAGKELPTEAEWEKGARGPLGFAVPWGEGDPLWGRTREVSRLTPVARYSADLSPYGLYDTAGNAREWVADWYQPDAFEQLLSRKGGAVRDPTGPKPAGANEQKVVKGGAADWRLTSRVGVVSNQRLPDVGFRCVVRLRPQGKGKVGK